MMASRRRGGRFIRSAVDFRCRGKGGGGHDKRAGLLWVDVRRPQTLNARLTGGRGLPVDARTVELGCPVCRRRVEVDLEHWRQALALRARSGPSTLVIPLHWVFWRRGTVPGVRPLGPVYADGQ